MTIPPQLLVLLLIVIIAVVFVGCWFIFKTDNAADNTIFGQDTFIKFQSQIGNTINYPSQWLTEDEGDTFRLWSPDGHAVISVATFTVAGSGSLEEFQETMVSSIKGDWRRSEATTIDIDGKAALTLQLDPQDKNGESSWRVYVLRDGDFYHSLVLNASSLVMEVNGGFYEELIRTFKGISGILPVSQNPPGTTDS